MPTQKYAAFKAAEPYFSLVRRALGDLVDGEHFFDTISDDTITRFSMISAGLVSFAVEPT